MIGWAAALLFAASLGGIAWYFLSSLKIKKGWQRENGPIARWLDARRREKFNSQLPEAIDTMTNALRAGFSMSQAFDSVAKQGISPVSEEFEILLSQLKIGMKLEDALDSMSDRVGSDDLLLVTTAITISRRTGGNVTEIFDRISETIRGRMKVERKVKSLTAQGRFQGLIISVLPFILGIIITIIKPGMMVPFLCSFTGIAAVVVMTLLIIAGWLMIRKIIKIDV